jgi:serine/threonine-protein kinase
MGDDPFPPDDLRSGEVLARKYKITDFLGRGGMGLVYAGVELSSATPVAVKLPRREIRNRKKALARFQQESRAATRLRGPNVVKVMEVAELGDGTPFIVMELLVGKDLASELDVRGALPVAEAVGYVLQAASGVAEAHAAGIIHRDLKPHNLFLVDEPGGRVVKVLDFGISKLGGAEAPRVTTTNARLGTPLYVSPEQLVSAKYVDQRSDIWSLGVILYELLTGTLPFEGQTAIAVAAAIQTIEPPPPSARRPGLPAGLERVVMKALAKKAEERFQTVADFARELAPFAGAGAASAPLAEPPRPARALEPLRRGGTHVDSPREDSVASGQSPPEEQTSTRAPAAETRTAAEPSHWLLLLAALFGIALLALALAYR